jgi:hypothetical protein
MASEDDVVGRQIIEVEAVGQVGVLLRRFPQSMEAQLMVSAMMPLVIVRYCCWVVSC